MPVSIGEASPAGDPSGWNIETPYSSRSYWGVVTLGAGISSKTVGQIWPRSGGSVVDGSGGGDGDLSLYSLVDGTRPYTGKVTINTGGLDASGNSFFRHNLTVQGSGTVQQSLLVTN